MISKSRIESGNFESNIEANLSRSRYFVAKEPKISLFFNETFFQYYKLKSHDQFMNFNLVPHI